MVVVEDIQLQILTLLNKYSARKCKLNYSFAIKNTKLTLDVDILPWVENHYTVAGGRGSRRRRRRRRKESEHVSQRNTPTAEAETPRNILPDARSQPRPTLIEKPVHTSPKSASQVWMEWKEQELAKRKSAKPSLQQKKEWYEQELTKMKSAKPKCELCPLVCICMDVDLNRKAVEQGQVARQCSLDPKQDVGLRRSTRQHTLNSNQTTSQPDQMHQNVTQFLKQ